MKFKNSNSATWKNTSSIMLGFLFTALLIMGCSNQHEDAIIEETSIESKALRASSKGKPFKGSFDLLRGVGNFPVSGTGVCGYVANPGAGRLLLGTSGQGNSTLMGLITVNSDLIIDAANIVAGPGPIDNFIVLPIIEHCAEITAANGDKVFVEIAPWLSVWDADCECRIGNLEGVVTGGTGRFEDATGTVHFIAKTFLNEADDGSDDLIEVEHNGTLYY